MKQLTLALCMVLIAACGGGNQPALQIPVCSGPASPEEIEQIDNEALAAAIAAAPVTLAEDIVRKLPEECRPAAGEEGIRMMLDGRSEEFPCSIYCDVVEDEIPEEYNVKGYELRAFPFLDGSSWFVAFIFWHGTDYFMQDPPRGFIYQGGKLTEVEWPIEEPVFEDFTVNDVVDVLGQEEVDNIKSMWHISYSFDVQENNHIYSYFDILDEYLEPYEIEEMIFDKSIEYFWTGEQFLRNDDYGD